MKGYQAIKHVMFYLKSLSFQQYNYFNHENTVFSPLH